MRSLADRLRVERALRIVALAALVLWIANAARPRTGRSEVARGTSLASALPRWTQVERVESVSVQLDTAPDAGTSAWLAALRGAGVGVSWSASALPTMALEVYPAADPEGGVLVLTSAPVSLLPVLSDAVGPIDTLARDAAPLTTRVAAVEGEVMVRAGLQPARGTAGQGRAPRRVFVTGAAGWESKFVIAALEESGWIVDARFLVAPGKDVWQGSGARAGLDTGRHAAVVLLDSAAAEQTRGVEPFARAGGGVVLAGDANRAGRVASLTAWRASRRETAPLGTLPADSAWRGGSRVPLDTILEARSVALEQRHGKAIVAARRYYAGRVVGVGYDQTWRWRMAGGDDAPAAHRAWWSRVVASVAQRPVISSPSPVIPSVAPAPNRREGRNLQFGAGSARDPQSGAAPLASLYDVLGPPSPSVRALPVMLSASALSNILGLVCLSALLGEWLLRRARGAR